MGGKTALFGRETAGVLDDEAGLETVARRVDFGAGPSGRETVRGWRFGIEPVPENRCSDSDLCNPPVWGPWRCLLGA